MRALAAGDRATASMPSGAVTQVKKPPRGVVQPVPSGMCSASARKVAYVPGGPFYPGDGGVSQLRLAYSRVEDDLIDEGARRLGDVFRTALEGS